MWSVIKSKTFVFSFIACAILIYVYLAVSTHSKATQPVLSFYLPIDSSENLMDFSNTDISRNSIEMILSLKRQIITINKEQRVQNANFFGEEVALVIVIQVHDKLYYLEQLIDSLKRAKGIDETLLIFSHSYCNDDINTLIRNISFAKVMQIFYPYSAQLHPIAFPGDQRICADMINCRNGDRDPLLMQPKHHWWWKAAFVFNEVRAIKDYNGSVLFLEEDQYVTEDFIYIVKVLERLVSVKYPNCDIITLGGNGRKVSLYDVKRGTATLKPWCPSDYIGVVFNRKIWHTMSSLSEHFCRYNDNRWINSLINLARKSSSSGFLALSIDSPRVFRFNECANNRSSCHEVEKVERVESLVKRIHSGLYPQNIAVRVTTIEENIVSNGKWRDERDQELCLYYSNPLQRTEERK